ncbi:hypothetical protein L2E82_49032 [Cichorium intybus]|uniref:Uncharacterized protein n=1 Tax=Cichorium intybus TaxID=13427 RepID=A0ACB8Z0E1_CICIN|nr:hypothetical protein L2E82_49032 [Cichorium intybus]
MRFHLPQSYAILPVSIHAILMEIELRVKELIRFYDFSMARQHAQGCIFSQPYFTPKNKPSDFKLRSVNQWDFIGDWGIFIGSKRSAQSSTTPTTNCSEVMEYHSELQPLRDATARDVLLLLIQQETLILVLLLLVTDSSFACFFKKTNKKITSDTYSDDDDFVNPPTVTLPIQKLVIKFKGWIDSLDISHVKREGIGRAVYRRFRKCSCFFTNTNMNHIDQEEDETEHEEDENVAAPKRDCVSPGRDTKEVSHDTPEKYEDYNVEEIMREINFNFNAYHNTMTAIDTWLVRGIKRFPDSEELRMLVTKRNHEFNLPCPYFQNSDVSHDGTFYNGVSTPVHGQEITTESKDFEFHEAVLEDDAHDDVVFSTPFTQVLNEEAYDIMERAALAASSKNSKQQSLNHDVPVIVAPRRTKRHVQPTEKFRSPYFKRVVNPNTALTSNEERVSGWIFAGLDNEWDLVFESKFGDLGYRGIFESMILGSRIHATVIDIWASILNHQERHRNKKSPARMFLSCTLLKILFTLYVDELNHKKVNRIKRAKPMSGSMEWTTKYNNIDCGVFLMRHMETYKGEDLDKWIIGFEREHEDNDDQHNQLDEMRKKYVTKILTWGLNVVKPSIFQMLASYDRLSDADKESFNTEEHLIHIESRISLFC